MEEAKRKKDSKAFDYGPPSPSIGGWVLRFVFLIIIGWAAFTIRLRAVQNYGKVIHEFDPWFNFRATQYLVDHGWDKFYHWFDTESWYPLGRPVGSTVYPGMMLTAAGVFHTSEALELGWNLNDICVFIPAFGGVLTSWFTFGLVRECAADDKAAIAAAAFMAVIPAHIMRSVAGMYDNESVAVPAIAGTFYFWVRALRTPSSWPIAIFSSFWYIYMAAAWGGYTFVINMVGVHAGVLLVWYTFHDNYQPYLWKAYTLFFLVGTSGALQFRIVGWAPLKSLEQMGPLLVFFGYQIVMVMEEIRIRQKMTAKEFQAFRIKCIWGACGIGVLVLAFFIGNGNIWALSVRVRSLFIRHTKTGNPLVDSVAEHQATDSGVFAQFFHMTIYLAPCGFFWLTCDFNASKAFLMLYFVITGYFSRKMMRLVLLLAPSCCGVAGVGLVGIVEWAATSLYESLVMDDTSQKVEKKEELTKAQKKQKGKQLMQESNKSINSARSTKNDNEFTQMLEESPGMKRGFSMTTLFVLLIFSLDFLSHCNFMAERLSEPQIMLRGRGREGGVIMFDDFREAYWWLRDNTPEDSRVMAWWDYGYQINGVANRTTIADGNTWNHEHIALLGKALVSNMTESHKIVKHLADYVLVWSTSYMGMQGDDLAKSPHMARIAGSVYYDIKAADFGHTSDGKPTKMMRECLLHKLHTWKLDKTYGNFNLVNYEHAYSSKHNMVRIYKVLNVDEDSRRHGKENHGTYPPGLEPILATRNSFDQRKRI